MAYVIKLAERVIHNPGAVWCDVGAGPAGEQRVGWPRRRSDRCGLFAKELRTVSHVRCGKGAVALD
jgi:hypothetical protein